MMASGSQNVESGLPSTLMRVRAKKKLVRKKNEYARSPRVGRKMPYFCPKSDLATTSHEAPALQKVFALK